MSEIYRPLTNDVISTLSAEKSIASKRIELERIAQRQDILDEVVMGTITDWIEPEFGADSKQSLSILSASLVMKSESYLPPQNWEEIVFQLAASTLPNEVPFTNWMFGCLVTDSKLDTKNNWPQVKIVNDISKPNQLELTKKRTKALVDVLSTTGIQNNWICPIADYDIKLLYSRVIERGDELSAQKTANDYIQRVALDFRKKVGSNVFVSNGSSYFTYPRSNFEQNREKALPLVSTNIPEEYQVESLNRRVKFFEGLGMKNKDQIKSLATEQMENQITGYAAEGAMLLSDIRPFSILTIADREASRLAGYTSLLTGEKLPIWFPYKEEL